MIAVGYPTQLVITAVPDTVPASAASTGYLILQLEDDVGLPAKAIADVPISLYSSNTNVVNVTAATTVMKQGEYLEEINYTSGFVPGSALITASAPGFASGTATISVLGSPPLALKLQAQPGDMVACSSEVTSCQGRLVVALTDLNGNPTLATRNIQVQIRSSDLAVVNANETATIAEGSISAFATFTVTSAIGRYQQHITASSPGLQSSSTLVTISPPSFVSPALCTSGASDNLPACDFRRDRIPCSLTTVPTAQLSSPSRIQVGTPAVNATGPTEVTLTSSVAGVGNFTSINFVIPTGQNWAAVTFTSTYQVGTTTLTASGQNVLPAETSLATYGAVPSQVIVSAISTPLPADGATHPALELSLEDASGSPAVAASDIPVGLSSSQDQIVSVADAVIPAGQTFAVVNVTAGILQGSANVTALVSSFTSGYASSSVDLSTVIPAPSALSAFAPNDNTIMFTPKHFASAAPHGRPTCGCIWQPSASKGPDEHHDYFVQQHGDFESTHGNHRGRAGLRIVASRGQSTGRDDAHALNARTFDDFACGQFPLLSRRGDDDWRPCEHLHERNVGHFGERRSRRVASRRRCGRLESFQRRTCDSHPEAHEFINHARRRAPRLRRARNSARSTIAVQPTGVPAVNDTTDTAGSSVAIFHPTHTGSILITAVVAPGGLLTRTLNFTVQVTAPPSSVGQGGQTEGRFDSRTHDIPAAPSPGRRSRRSSRRGLPGQEEERRQSRRRPGIRHVVRVSVSRAQTLLTRNRAHILGPSSHLARRIGHSLVSALHTL